MRKRYFRVAFLLLVSGTIPVLGQQSANFSMDRISVTAGGNTAASANFETTVVIGQDSPSGASSFCNSGFINTAGFWSVLGDAPVSIVLAVGKDAANPNQVELSWSGANPVFHLYSSTLPTDVLDPLNLTLATATCSASDSPLAALVFYKVVPKP